MLATNKLPSSGGLLAEPFLLALSQVVIDEISVGDPMEVRKRLAVAATIKALAVTVDAERIT